MLMLKFLKKHFTFYGKAFFPNIVAVGAYIEFLQLGARWKFAMDY